MSIGWLKTAIYSKNLFSFNHFEPTKRLLYDISAFCCASIIPNLDHFGISCWIKISKHEFVIKLLNYGWIHRRVHTCYNIIKVSTIIWIDIDLSLKAENCVLSSWQDFNAFNFFSEVTDISAPSIQLLFCFLWQIKHISV